MNKARRKQIEAVRSELTTIHEKLQLILEDEQESFENIPENLQESDRYCGAEELIEIFEELVDELESINERLKEEIINA